MNGKSESTTYKRFMSLLKKTSESTSDSEGSNASLDCSAGSSWLKRSTEFDEGPIKKAA